MPIIQFNLMEGRSDALKRELAKRVSETVSEVLDVSPDTVRILIHELGQNDYSVAGQTFSERSEKAKNKEVCNEKN
jgi:4-oxalocrotonate tautomerase